MFLRKILPFCLLAASSVFGKESDSPLQAFLGYESIGDAKFKDTDLYDGEKVKYSIGAVDASGIVWYNPACKEGMILMLGYDDTEIRWNENPYFDQTHFHTAHFGVAGFTHRATDWVWKGSVMINFDTDHVDFERYLTWDLLLWGRYQYNQCLGFNIGFLVMTGMMVDWVYPIIGFDWEPSDKWELHAVFPVDISTAYHINDRWSIAGAVRFFRSRHRSGFHEPLPKAVVTYENTGAEIGVVYECARWVVANAHVGYTTGGRLKVANQDYSNPQHFRFRSSPYFGGEIAFKW